MSAKFDAIIDMLTAEAEAKGYQRGLSSALMRCDMEMHNGPFPFDAAKQEAHQWTAKAIRSAIYELLEQTGYSYSPHPEIGAGRSAESE